MLGPIMQYQLKTEFSPFYEMMFAIFWLFYYIFTLHLTFPNQFMHLSRSRTYFSLELRSEIYNAFFCACERNSRLQLSMECGLAIGKLRIIHWSESILQCKAHFGSYDMYLLVYEIHATSFTQLSIEPMYVIEDD